MGGIINQKGPTLKLAGKKILITGAALRIGKEIATHLAAKGARVLIHYHRSEAEAERLSQQLQKKYGIKPGLLSADLSQADQVLALAETAWKKFGPIDALVNNASTFYSTSVGRQSAAEWEGLFSVNTLAPFLLCDRLGSRMKRRGQGKIVNIADWNFLKPNARFIPYSASKAALLSVSQGYARALAPQVQVHSILPGPILWPSYSDTVVQKKVVAKTLVKKMGDPKDIAKSVEFLLESSTFMTGTLLHVDGGASLF